MSPPSIQQGNFVYVELDVIVVMLSSRVVMDKSQISKSEFEKMHLKSSLLTKDLPTILEFDKKRNAPLKSQDTITEDI